MLSIDSTVREVLGDRRAKEVLDKYVPGASAHSMIHMAYGMTLRTAASYIGTDPELLEKIDKELKELK